MLSSILGSPFQPTHRGIFHNWISFSILWKPILLLAETSKIGFLLLLECSIVVKLFIIICLDVALFERVNWVCFGPRRFKGCRLFTFYPNDHKCFFPGRNVCHSLSLSNLLISSRFSHSKYFAYFFLLIRKWNSRKILPTADATCSDNIAPLHGYRRQERDLFK